MGIFGIGNKPYEEVSAREVSAEWPYPGAVMLDVRTPGEYSSGHVPGSVHVDMMGAGFRDKVSALDKTATYYVICRSGNRSGAASGLMHQLGFERVINVRGGMSAWRGPVQ